MGFDLPQYSTSGPAPDYSFKPACGERTLQRTPCSIRSTTETAFIRKSGKTTVVLYNQEDNVKMPSYGREALVAGSLLFDSSDSICEVVFEISGKIETMSSEGGAETTTVLGNKRVLWSNRYKSGQCPSQIEFSIQIPRTFRNGQEERPLPPTYAVDFPNIPALYVRSSYYMRISITCNLTKKVGFLTKIKRVFIPFKYYPRIRPHRPIVPSLCFSSSVKRTPEEWHQAIAQLKTPSNADLGPIFGHLLIPSSRIYGLRDSIPFHVQLSGPEDVLCAFLKPAEAPSRRKRSVNKKLSTNTPSILPIPCQSLCPKASTQEPPISEPLSLFTTNSNSLPWWSDDTTRPSLRVFLLRQVVLETRGRKQSCRNQILGEAKLLAVPPLLAAGCSHEEIRKEDHLDWEGELRIDSRYDVGSWQAAGVRVKDFIALSFVPQSERTSPLSGVQLTVPVKLVTDTYSEGPNGYPAPFETQ